MCHGDRDRRRFLPATATLHRADGRSPFRTTSSLVVLSAARVGGAARRRRSERCWPWACQRDRNRDRKRRPNRVSSSTGRDGQPGAGRGGQHGERRHSGRPQAATELARGSRQRKHPPARGTWPACVLRRSPRQCLAFTVDDGPGVYTHYAVKKLTEAHEQASFFVVGKSIEAWPGWLTRELKVGTLGDHTFTHADLLELAPSQVASELETNKQLIERDSGQPVDLFRPPYGAQDPAVNRIARQLGLLDIMWSMDSRDSLGANWAGIIENVESRLASGRNHPHARESRPDDPRPDHAPARPAPAPSAIGEPARAVRDRPADCCAGPRRHNCLLGPPGQLE